MNKYYRKNNKISITAFSLFVIAIMFMASSHRFLVDSSHHVAALPPAYLSINGWQACVFSQSKGSWKSLCLPNTKPSGCKSKAWQLLQALTGADALPLCNQDNVGEQVVTSADTMHSVAF